MTGAQSGLHTAKHASHALFSLILLPQEYIGEDSNRMSLAYFSLGILSLSGALSEPSPSARLPERRRTEYLAWIYAQQSSSGGFRGAPGSDESHLAMTYTALLSLAMLGDTSLSHVDRVGAVAFVKACQGRDGSFAPFPRSNERDVRFSYCACAIATLLDDWSCIDRDSLVHYLLRCRGFDGAFGQVPGAESQGGTTYCCLASLAMADSLHKIDDPASLIRWSVSRQVEPDEEQREALAERGQTDRMAGFEGRPGKPPDACYSFWQTASLQILGEDVGDVRADTAWLLACQDERRGGIARSPGDYSGERGTALCAQGVTREARQISTIRISAWQRLPCTE
ncbi:uncharacterized protein L969DRAFT_47466 [Mixia osmundae IAM 14324]|uniref:Prenyltransferase alpha-alpha toroid domain-containing protein n=1 Tax=Mixia osmundae (strain CBS 9802 / IAM 14324 / JCM 22182 / KY 12970) TaxID=764103 RepID=G7E8R0_MIXOS|nr:uncharacterized protein L969DRAFT_47466 [Mixia osmundae IAM 14324]KEI40164.1 hypothetical protein L969DRAFT_47466 [Mixia osmundae IAM 14324]GAA99528.1 hypothetical protein E5Q_06229 [Mixia osmundae IAM 14324]